MNVVGQCVVSYFYLYTFVSCTPMSVAKKSEVKLQVNTKFTKTVRLLVELAFTTESTVVFEFDFG